VHVIPNSHPQIYYTIFYLINVIAIGHERVFMQVQTCENLFYNCIMGGVARCSNNFGGQVYVYVVVKLEQMGRRLLLVKTHYGNA
jgi:hypothetical protein